jgi:hypothetical protein
MPKIDEFERGDVVKMWGKVNGMSGDRASGYVFDQAMIVNTVDKQEWIVHCMWFDKNGQLNNFGFEPFFLTHYVN